MERKSPTLWLHPSVASPNGCGSCISSPSGPVCRSHAGGQACAAPDLVGAEQPLRRVMTALNLGVVDPGSGRGIVDLHWVKSLRIDDDEAELTVTFPPTCGSGKQLAEGAFDTLRRLLPDTDVYVRHAC